MLPQTLHYKLQKTGAINQKITQQKIIVKMTSEQRLHNDEYKDPVKAQVHTSYECECDTNVDVTNYNIRIS